MQEFKYKVQVLTEDVDCFGIVYHSKYINFMERARLTWLWQKGFRVDVLFAQNIFFVIKKIDIDYLAPARLYDELEIYSRLIEVRKIALCYEQTIYLEKDPKKIFCNAVVQVVCVNDKLRPRALPKELISSN